MMMATLGEDMASETLERGGVVEGLAICAIAVAALEI